MANNLNTIPNNFILYSSESIRKKMLDRIKEYEELNGVDLSKSTFLSYMTDILSILSSDNANAITLSKRESYLVTATLPSSIYNWASYLSYTKGFAVPCKVDALLTIPLAFTEDTTFTIAYDTQFKANDIIYTNPDEYFSFTYNVEDNTLTAKAIGPNTARSLRVATYDNNAYVLIPLTQVVKESEERYIPYDLQMYQPYSFTVQYSDKLSNIRVYLKADENAEEEEWQRADSYFNMGIGEKKYYFKYDSNNTVRIMFGNDMFGRQPDPGAIVRIEFYETKANYGAIIPGSLTKMDRITHTDANGKIKQVSINVTNTAASSTGESDESINDTRRKAIARFQARQRIVSADDHDKIKDIISGSLPYDFSKSILKRSDIKSNEVNLYVVIPRERIVRDPESIIDTSKETQSLTQTIPVPTTSLVGEMDVRLTQLMPYHTFVEKDIEYVCPLGFVKENSSFGYYFYLVNEMSMSPTAHVNDQITYPLSFTNFRIKSKNNYELYDIELTYFNLDNIVDMDNISIKMFMTYNNDSQGPYSCTIDKEKSIIKYELPAEEIHSGSCVVEYQVKDNTTNKIIAKVNCTLTLRKELRNYMYSNISTVDEISYIYDVPCVLKEYYDNLSEDEKVTFESDIIQKLIANNTLDDYRMMNVSVNIKFARTCGYSQNYYLNNPTKGKVIDILNAPPTPTELEDGARYIVGENPSGLFSGQNGKIALYSADNGWFFLDSAPGDIVTVINKGEQYTYSGNANYWFVPKFEIPFKITVYVYVNSLAENDGVVVKAVKNQLMYVLTETSNMQTDQHRSAMYQAIQQIGSYIDHCEIRIPEVDLVYNYSIDKLTKEQLKRYVPEYIYTTENEISVKVLHI